MTLRLVELMYVIVIFDKTKCEKKIDYFTTKYTFVILNLQGVPYVLHSCCFMSNGLLGTLSMKRLVGSLLIKQNECSTIFSL